MKELSVIDLLNDYGESRESRHHGGQTSSNEMGASARTTTDNKGPSDSKQNQSNNDAMVNKGDNPAINGERVVKRVFKFEIVDAFSPISISNGQVDTGQDSDCKVPTLSKTDGDETANSAKKVRSSSSNSEKPRAKKTSNSDKTVPNGKSSKRTSLKSLIQMVDDEINNDTKTKSDPTKSDHLSTNLNSQSKPKYNGISSQKSGDKNHYTRNSASANGRAKPSSAQARPTTSGSVDDKRVSCKPKSATRPKSLSVASNIGTCDTDKAPMSPKITIRKPSDDITCGKDISQISSKISKTPKLGWAPKTPETSRKDKSGQQTPSTPEVDKVAKDVRKSPRTPNGTKASKVRTLPGNSRVISSSPTPSEKQQVETYKQRANVLKKSLSKKLRDSISEKESVASDVEPSDMNDNDGEMEEDGEEEEEEETAAKNKRQTAEMQKKLKNYWSSFGSSINKIDDKTEYFQMQPRKTFKSSDGFKNVMTDMFGNSEYGRAKSYTMLKTKINRLANISGVASKLFAEISKPEENQEEIGEGEEEVDEELKHEALVSELKGAKRGWKMLKRHVQETTLEENSKDSNVKWSMIRHHLMSMSDLGRARQDLYERYGVLPCQQEDGSFQCKNVMWSQRAVAMGMTDYKQYKLRDTGSDKSGKKGKRATSARPVSAARSGITKPRSAQSSISRLR